MDDWIRSVWVVWPDPEGYESVETPEYQLCSLEESDGKIYGDCDNCSTLAAAILIVNQIPCWFVAIRLPQDITFTPVFLRTEERDIDPLAELYLLPHRPPSYMEKIELML